MRLHRFKGRGGTPPVLPTLATLTGSDSASTGAAHTSRVTLDAAADVAYTVAWARSNSGTGPATSIIAIGQTYVEASSTWAAAGSGRTVDFTISPSLTRAGRPLTVMVADAPALPTGVAYRTASPSLFVDAVATSGASRISGVMSIAARGGVSAPKDDFIIGRYGPSYAYVDTLGTTPAWAWANPGGDWINTAGTAQATTSPHATFTANTVTSGSAAYTADITSGVQQAHKRGKWNAYIAKTSASTRSIASIMNAARPAISVSYVDGTSGTLACTACVALPSGTAYTQIGDTDASVGSAANQAVALEFQMPAKFIASATLNITLTAHTATPCSVNLYLASPAYNQVAATQGLAAGYHADVGITGNAAVLFAQRYADGTTLTDYVIPAASTAGLDTFASANWDQSLWGGSSDTTKLPTSYGALAIAGTNKWLHKQNFSANVSLVSSSYTGDSFAPFAPGVGALRIVTPGSTAADGAATGGNGSVGSDLIAYFDKSVAGLVSEVYVRFPIRFAWSPNTIAATKMYRDSGGTSAAYAVPTGKWGVGVHHWTSYGGNGGYQGSQHRGWTNRLGYEEVPAEMPLGGVIPFVHSYDNFADGHNMAMGQDGLGSSFYPNCWYEVEIRLLLNTYNPSTGASSADGVVQVWIDGRLCATHTGFKYRDGAISYVETPNGPALAPFRELGAYGAMLNNFNGGHLPPDHDLVTFYGPTVIATQRIGPFRPAKPSWVPAVNGVAAIGYAKGTHPQSLPAVLEELDPKHYPAWNPNYPGSGPWETEVPVGFNTITNYSGGAWSSTQRRWYGMGGGHQCFNVPMIFWHDMESHSWAWADTPIPSDGISVTAFGNGGTITGPDIPAARAAMAADYPAAQFDTTEWHWLGGYSGHGALRQPLKIFPEAAHTYYGLVWVPGASVGNVNGILLKLFPGGGKLADCLVPERHYFDLDDNLWKLTANFRSNPSAAAGGSIYFGGSIDRAFSCTNTSGGTIRSQIDVFNPSTLTWSLSAAATYNLFLEIQGGGFLAHLPSNLLIAALPATSQSPYASDASTRGGVAYTGANQHQFWANKADALKAGSANTWQQLTISNPGGTWPVRIPPQYGTFCGMNTWVFCPLNGCFYAINGAYNTTTLWKLSPPSGAVTQADHLSGTWVITTQTLSTGIPCTDSGGLGRGTVELANRLVWDDQSECLLWFDPWIEMQVQAIRPF